MDGRAGVNAARRGGQRSCRKVGAVRRRGRLRSRPLHSDRKGDGGHASGLRPEREAASTRTGLPAARAHPRLGGQRIGQVGPAHQGIGPALALAQRDRALHRSDAPRQMAAIQLRHGVQVRHHETLGRDEAHRAGHLSDRWFRLVGKRHNQSSRRHGRWRQDLARGGAGRTGPRSLPDPLPLRLGLGWRPSQDREPRRRQWRVRTAQRGRDRESPRSSASCGITTEFSRGR